MSTTELDSCYCIVRHPDAAKFLVVKHEESWTPPVLKFPSGNIDQRVSMINQGMFDKYGLRTRILRPLQHAPNQHCIEMELVSLQPAKKIQAVWVDQSEYLRTRSAQGKLPDPYARWFEQEAEPVPGQRPAFQRPGWFDQASHWIDFQLDSLGVQARGSIEQFQQGKPTSCVLRVGSIDGWIHFKATHGPGANEAALLAALSPRWPQVLHKPLAVDARRNWVLQRDVLKTGQPGAELTELQPFYAAMAKLQLDSLNCLDDLQNAGCQQFTLEDLGRLCQQAELHQSRWQEGGGGLKDAELQRFYAVLQGRAEDCQALQEIGLPMMLVHPDFRTGNMVQTGGGHKIINWSGACIANPLLVLMPLIRGLAGRAESPTRLTDIRNHYLPALADVAAADPLNRALDLVTVLEPVWTLQRKLQLLEWLEPGSPYYFFQVVSLQAIARQLANVA